jgi:hypothetical protein
MEKAQGVTMKDRERREREREREIRLLSEAQDVSTWQ